MMSFTLDPQLDADTRLITRLDLCDVLLMDDSRYLWCIIVPRLPDLRDFHEVPGAQKATFLSEIDRVSEAANQLAGAYKMNVAALGNMVEQLHVHIIARHTGDAAWPGPVWGVGSAEPYSEDQASKLIAQIRDELGVV
jgi:diadenosine tetraphosphate (Ap4A) HIT family hydrolase